MISYFLLKGFVLLFFQKLEYAEIKYYLDTYPPLLPPIMMIDSPSGTPHAPSPGGFAVPLDASEKVPLP